MTIRDSVNLLLSTAPSSATARIGERIGKADEEAMGGATPEAAAIALVAIARQNPRSGELLRMIQTAGMDQHIDEATYLLGQRLRTDAALGIISGTTKKEGNPFERLEEGLLETLTLNTDNPVPLAGLAETAAYAAGYNADNTLFSPVIQHLYRADTGLVVRAIHGARDISDEAAERLLEQFAVRLDDDSVEALLLEMRKAYDFLSNGKTLPIEFQKDIEDNLDRLYVI